LGILLKYSEIGTRQHIAPRTDASCTIVPGSSVKFCCQKIQLSTVWNVCSPVHSPSSADTSCPTTWAGVLRHCAIYIDCMLAYTGYVLSEHICVKCEVMFVYVCLWLGGRGSRSQAGHHQYQRMQILGIRHPLPPTAGDAADSAPAGLCQLYTRCKRLSK